MKLYNFMIENRLRFSERMTAMRKMSMIFTFLAAFCIFGAAGWAYPPNYTGKIIVEGKKVLPGESFTVKIILDNNNFAIAGLSIPLRIKSDYLVCDYVDFSGTILAPGMQPYSIIGEDKITISYIPNPNLSSIAKITADSGLIATLYMTVLSTAPDHITYIDSVYKDSTIEHNGDILHIWNRVEMADTLGAVTILPDFAAGKIVIGNALGIDEDNGSLIPTTISLSQNFPNPFNPATSISFSLPERAAVNLEIYNVLGQSIDILADQEEFPAGKHSLTWDASDNPSGVYFYRLTVGNEILTKKMALMK
jgi:hypothetical protein